jgi:SagB-type dehydrogenase family enzyme
VEGTTARMALRPSATVLRDALLRFAPPGEDEEHLAALVADGNGGLARWYYYLERLSQRGLICYALHAHGACLATLVPTSPTFVAQPARRSASGRCVLSRFAYMRREGADCLLESPLAHARIILNDVRTTAIVGRLTVPATLDELAAGIQDLSTEAIAGTLALLRRAGMLQELTAADMIPEDDDPSLRTWAFHDLVFHARSRKGRSDAPYGGTYRFAGAMEPPPALKQPPSGDTHDLYRPALARLEREDPPLAQVQERRRSVRTFDRGRPIAARQLGEFLFRVGRVRDYREIEVATPNGPRHLDMASRPYPAGGGLYELELYVAVNSCADLAAGLFYYDPARHRLTRIAGRAENVTTLLADAADSTGIPHDEVQLLMIVAARYPRLAWKYESIAYSLILKHVGVLYQTMYLAATAMGLAACAVGGGDSDLFARATGASYMAETSVGEFLLGSQPAHLVSDDRRGPEPSPSGGEDGGPQFQVEGDK